MIGLALKNYSKETLWMSKSIHRIKRYSHIYIEVSWFVKSQLIWSNNWIGHKKLPQNEPLNVQIHPLVKRYSDIYIEFSWFVQLQLIWSNYWIGLEKQPQNDPLNVQIRLLVQKIQWYLYWSQLICTVTADLI